jgi:hypothetical protein
MCPGWRLRSATIDVQIEPSLAGPHEFIGVVSVRLEVQSSLAGVAGDEKIFVRLVSRIGIDCRGVGGQSIPIFGHCCVHFPVLMA